ncbi:MAG: hypothetical protein ABSD43_09235, partial [Terracidiphilus sp.]
FCRLDMAEALEVVWSVCALLCDLIQDVIEGALVLISSHKLTDCIVLYDTQVFFKGLKLPIE